MKLRIGFIASAILFAVAAGPKTVLAGSGDQQDAVCKVFTDSLQQFKKLQAEWKLTDQANGVAKTLARDGLHKRIDALFTERNETIVRLLGPGPAHLKGWKATLSRLDLVDRNYGKGTKRYVEISGQFPCGSVPVFFSNDVEATEAVGATVEKLATIDMKTPVFLDGDLKPHDEDHQSASAALQWGNPVWGPFGGLWEGAFTEPKFVIRLSKLEQ